MIKSFLIGIATIFLAAIVIAKVDLQLYQNDELIPWTFYPCPGYEVILDDPTQEWSVLDEIELRYSSKRCPEVYGPKSCLRLFVRVSDRNYHVICRTDDERP